MTDGGTTKKEPYEDIDVPLVATMGIAGTLLTLVVVVVFQTGYYNYEQTTMEARRNSERWVESDQAVSEQKARLASYGWIDKEKAVAAIPVERAMALVTQEEHSKASGNVQ